MPLFQNVVDGIASALASSFADDVFYQSVTVRAKDPSERYNMLCGYFGCAVAEADAVGMIEYSAAASASDDASAQLAAVDGAALWTFEKPRDAMEAALRSKLRKEAMLPFIDSIWQEGLANYVAIAGSMSSLVPPFLSSESGEWGTAASSARPSWYLSILAVREEARGRGLAQRLLEPTFDRADAAGAICWLETFNPKSLGFYRRVGFSHTIELTEPITGAVYWLLWRDPRGQDTQSSGV